MARGASILVLAMIAWTSFALAQSAPYEASHPVQTPGEYPGAWTAHGASPTDTWHQGQNGLLVISATGERADALVVPGLNSSTMRQWSITATVQGATLRGQGSRITFVDPANGTGVPFVAAADYILDNTSAATSPAVVTVYYNFASGRWNAYLCDSQALADGAIVGTPTAVGIVTGAGETFGVRDIIVRGADTQDALGPVPACPSAALVPAPQASRLPVLYVGGGILLVGVVGAVVVVARRKRGSAAPQTATLETPIVATEESTHSPAPRAVSDGDVRALRDFLVNEVAADPQDVQRVLVAVRADATGERLAAEWSRAQRAKLDREDAWRAHEDVEHALDPRTREAANKTIPPLAPDASAAAIRRRTEKLRTLPRAEPLPGPDAPSEAETHEAADLSDLVERIDEMIAGLSPKGQKTARFLRRQLSPRPSRVDVAALEKRVQEIRLRDINEGAIEGQLEAEAARIARDEAELREDIQRSVADAEARLGTDFVGLLPHPTDRRELERFRAEVDDFVSKRDAKVAQARAGVSKITTRPERRDADALVDQHFRGAFSPHDADGVLDRLAALTKASRQRRDIQNEAEHELTHASPAPGWAAFRERAVDGPLDDLARELEILRASEAKRRRNLDLVGQIKSGFAKIPSDAPEHDELKALAQSAAEDQDTGSLEDALHDVQLAVEAQGERALRKAREDALHAIQEVPLGPARERLDARARAAASAPVLLQIEQDALREKRDHAERVHAHQQRASKLIQQVEIIARQLPNTRARPGLLERATGPAAADEELSRLEVAFNRLSDQAARRAAMLKDIAALQDQLRSRLLAAAGDARVVVEKLEHELAERQEPLRTTETRMLDLGLVEEIETPVI